MSNFTSPRPQIKRTLLIIVTFFTIQFFSINLAKANNVLGADITYERVDSLKYKISLQLFRDCRGVPLNASLLNIVCSSNSDTLKLKREKIEDVSNVCSKYSSPCSPANTRASKGIERHIYTANLDLTQSRFKSMKSCGEIRIEYGSCCRNAAITTINTGNFYTYSLLNIKVSEDNSSPKIILNPLMDFCINQPKQISYAAFDADGDSLSYEFGEVLSGYGRPLKFKGLRTYKKPYTDYDPSGTGYSSPFAEPPIGTTLNPSSGQFSFTPTAKEIGPMVVVIKEWRLIGGSYQQIGEIRRDQLYSVLTCGANNFPKITGSLNNRICENDSIELVFNSSDKAFVVPPNPAPPKDTTTFKWYSNLKNASFSNTPDSLNDQLNFKWVPDRKIYTKSQYHFVLELNDNSCASEARMSYTVNLNLDKGINSTRSITKLNCGAYAISSLIDKNIASFITSKHTIKAIDQTSNIDFKYARFKGGRLFSNTANDTIQFDSIGKFIIISEYIGASGICNNIVVDTIEVKPFKPVLTIPKDKILCCDAGTINLISGTKPSGGTWSCTQNPSYIEFGYEFNTAKACDPDAKTVHFVTYDYADPTSGCSNSDSSKITLNPLPRLKLKDITVCQDRDTIALDEFLVLPARLTGPSRAVNCLDCGSYNFSKILIEDGPSFDKQYKFDISNKAMNLGSKIIDSIIVEFVYGDANSCFVRDTATIIVKKVPEIKFLAIPDMCWNEGEVDLKARTAVIPYDGNWTCHDTTFPWPLFRNCKDPLMNGALDTSVFYGDTLNTLKTNKDGGIYYMRFTHTRSGCPVYRDTFMTIHPLPKPVIDESVLDNNLIDYTPPPYVLCRNNKDIELVATPTGGVWTHNSSFNVLDGHIFKPSLQENESLIELSYKTTDKHGCVGSSKVNAWVQQKPSITREGDKLTASKGTRFQWYLNSEKLIGEDKQSIIATKKGDYKVEVDQTCGRNFTDDFTVDNLSAKQIKKSAIVLYPNPAKDYVLIKFQHSMKANLCLFDITGKCIYRHKINASEIRVNTKEFPRGVYWLEIEGEKETLRKKLILE